MASTDQFDILLQFQLTVLQDLQHRILNASPLTTLWMKSPLSRRIEQAVPPLEVKACWNTPDVAISDGDVELSAELNGGARQVLSGRILTLDGTVSARQTVISSVDTSQRPYVCLEEPTSVQVDLRQLKVSYEGSRWPELLATLNPVKEATALRPVLATQLFEPLARIPLTYMPCSLPLSVPDTQGVVASGTLPIKRVVPGLLATPVSVALGMMLYEKRAAQSIFAGALSPKTDYNAAIAFSEHGLNAMLTHLCAQGEAIGQIDHTHFGEIEWRWEQLNVTLRQDVLTVLGLLVQQGVKLSVVAEVRSKLVHNGCVQSHIVASNVDANGAETLLAAWNGVLYILLRSRTANSQDQDARDAVRLYQCFAIPASTRTVESVAQELLVTDEQLIIYYTIPKSEEEVPLEIPPAKPAILITQPHMPQQTVQGAPVTIELDAQITKESTPPYDYAWTSDLSPNPVPQFGSTFTISSIPVAAATEGGPQTLTTVHLKVIDMFGQDAETQAPAKYLPSTKKQQQQSGEFHVPHLGASGAIGSVPKWLLIALAGLVVVAASGITLALMVSHHAGGTGGTPTLPGPITSFSVPTTGSNPYGITKGPDGNLWFTEMSTDKIGRITPKGAITEFSLPTTSSGLWDITAGSDGNLWFTEVGKIGRITPSGAITEFSISTGGNPTSITAGPDGNLWFIENGNLGRITPGGAITEFSLPGLSGNASITAGPDGNLWFTEYGVNQIRRITPFGAITNFPLPTTVSDISAITKGPDGNLWFTEYFGNKIWRITPGGTTTGFPIPTVDSGPIAITAGPDGNLWFTENAGQIGRITPRGTITEYPLPSASGPGYSPYGIIAGPDGNLWFTEYFRNKIGRITPRGKITGVSTPINLASDSSGDLTANLPGTYFR
jgi:streptogramin lyase